MKQPALVLLIVLLVSGALAGQCHVPAYQEHHVWTETAPNVRQVAISIAPQDLAAARLVCLAEHFKAKYAAFREILILIFSDPEAAVRYSVGLRATWCQHYHANYHFDTTGRTDELAIFPIENYAPGITVIRLPAKALPPCKLSLAGRCLLAADWIEYPIKAWHARTSGKVLLEAVISPAGEVAEIRVSPTPVEGRVADDAFVKSALKNLATWHFEANSAETRFQITFSYQVDPTLKFSEDPELNYDLRNVVEIRVGPL